MAFMWDRMAEESEDTGILAAPRQLSTAPKRTRALLAPHRAEPQVPPDRLAPWNLPKVLTYVPVSEGGGQESGE